MRKQKAAAEGHTDDEASAPCPEEAVAESLTDAELAELVAKCAALADENAQLKDQLMRTMADLQNFRKRAAVERATLLQFANEGLVLELLPVLDNFERTLSAVDSGASAESVIEGVRATDRQMRAVLEARNVMRLDVYGAEFDPDQHHALATHETDEFPEGTVTHELEAGYRMSDKVIRPAKVRVAKKP